MQQAKWWWSLTVWQLNVDLLCQHQKNLLLKKWPFFEVCETVAKQVLASGSLVHNPIVPSIQEMVAIHYGL